MATVKWTKDQESAIRLRPKKMLVSAAAGSGKTAVLSERILSRLTDETADADITRFLIVTYTRLAAAELRSRIGKKLREAAANATGELSRRLSKQCNRLGSAYISTIHSYCGALVKRHFRELDLPPVLKVCEEAQAIEIKEKLMDALIESAYNGQFDPIPDFENFANNFVTSSDQMLTEKLLKLYQTVVGLPDGFAKWEHSALLLASDIPFLTTPWGDITVSGYQRKFRYFILNYEKCIEALSYDPKCEKYRALAESELEMLRSLSKAMESRDPIIISDLLSQLSFASLPSVRSPESAEQRDHFRSEVRNPLKEFIAELKNEPIFSTDGSQNGDSEAMKAIRSKCSNISLALVALLKEFDERYKAEKRRLGILDFADLEQYTYKLLYAPDGSLTPLSHEVSRSFDEIFVDEFQDVNPMQSKIFEALSCECSIFQVGDIKQSIYGFRGAEPNIFADCRRSYTALDRSAPETENAEELTVFLSANFRSTYPVTAFVNRVFAPILHTPDDHPTAKDRIPYSSADQLICKRRDAYEDEECTIPIKDAAPVKMIMIEVPRSSRAKKDTEEEAPTEPRLTATEAECLTVAREIHRLIKSGVKGSDIAIVARSSNHVALIEEMLLSRGITASNDKGAPLADMPEVQLALSVLSCVDNPHRDVALAGALRSPIFNFTFNDLITVRNHKKGVSLFSALQDYTDEHNFEKGHRFIEFIERIRTYSAGQPASRVLWQIYNETDFFSLIYDGGKASPVLAASRRANLIKLHSIASGGENVGRDGIHTFIRRFEKLSATSNAPTASSVNDGSTVKFYTAHGSKGLEFPHCFVCGLGHSPKKSQQRDTTADTVCDNDLGIAVKLRDSTAIVKMDTPIRKAIAEKMRYTQFEEELRILYVELTRARDNLYVTATTENMEKTMNVAKNAAAINDPTAYENLSTPLEWLLTALHTEENGSVFLPPELLQIQKLTEEEIRAESTNEIENDTVNPEENTKKADPDPTLTDLLTKRFNAKYKYELSASLPAKMSVSKLYPTLLDEDDNQADPLYSHIQKAASDTEAEPSAETENAEISTPKFDLPAAIAIKSKNENKAAPLKTPLFALGSRLTGIRDRIAENESDTNAAVRTALKFNKHSADLIDPKTEVSATEKGTAAHLFMQFFDPKNAEKNGIDAEIERLCDKQFILPYHAVIIDRSIIENFMKSKTYVELQKAKRVRREVRFNTRLPAYIFTSDAEKAEALRDESLLVQGVIDCYYTTEDGETVLLDYKTDTFPEYMSEKQITAILRKRHSMQLYYYKLALERLLVRPVDRVEIFSFALGKTVSLHFEH